MRFIAFIIVLAVLVILIVYPFLPGEYDQLSFPIATSIQIFSGVGLITLLPALFWIIYIKGNRIRKHNTSPAKARFLLRLYIWTLCLSLILVALMSTFGLSKIVGMAWFLFLIVFTILLLKKTNAPDLTSSFGSASSICFMLLPIFLLSFQFLVDELLVSWSRSRAISNCQQLIEEIERYKATHQSYPPTLNGLWPDYKSGVTGIEKYNYSFDNSTYNLYFVQPRFFFDRFGTQELVVYNPTDEHQILSHASWNLHMTPAQRRHTQGWYASHETGAPHWKYFWFD